MSEQASFSTYHLKHQPCPVVESDYQDTTSDPSDQVSLDLLRHIGDTWSMGGGMVLNGKTLSDHLYEINPDNPNNEQKTRSNQQEQSEEAVLATQIMSVFKTQMGDKIGKHMGRYDLSAEMHHFLTDRGELTIGQKKVQPVFSTISPMHYQLDRDTGEVWAIQTFKMSPKEENGVLLPVCMLQLRAKLNTNEHGQVQFQLTDLIVENAGHIIDDLGQTLFKGSENHQGQYEEQEQKEKEVPVPPDKNTHTVQKKMYQASQAKRVYSRKITDQLAERINREVTSTQPKNAPFVVKPTFEIKKYFFQYPKNDKKTSVDEDTVPERLAKHFLQFMQHTTDKLEVLNPTSTHTSWSDDPSALIRDNMGTVRFPLRVAIRGKDEVTLYVSLQLAPHNKIDGIYCIDKITFESKKGFFNQEEQTFLTHLVDRMELQDFFHDVISPMKPLEHEKEPSKKTKQAAEQVAVEETIRLTKISQLRTNSDSVQPIPAPKDTKKSSLQTQIKAIIRQGERPVLTGSLPAGIQKFILNLAGMLLPGIFVTGMMFSVVFLMEFTPVGMAVGAGVGLLGGLLIAYNIFPRLDQALHMLDAPVTIDNEAGKTKVAISADNMHQNIKMQGLDNQLEDPPSLLNEAVVSSSDKQDQLDSPHL